MENLTNFMRLTCSSSQTNLIDQKACTMGYVHVSPTAVDGGEAGDEERPLELDKHVAFEGDPDFARDRRGPVAQRAWSWSHGVVAGVLDDVHGHVSPAVVAHLSCEPDGARSEPMPICGPIVAPAPAPVDHVRAGGEVGGGKDEEEEEEEGESERCNGSHLV